MLPQDTYCADFAHRRGERTIRAALIFCYLLVCLASLLLALHYSAHRLSYQSDRLSHALYSLIPLCAVASSFLFARFSFGYLAGFYLYTVAFGFIFLSWFTSFEFNYTIARISAIASTVAFLIPALGLSAPLRWRLRISPKMFEQLLDVMLVVSAITIVVGATYNFRLVGLDRIHDFRSTLKFPTPVGYLIGTVSSTVLPYLFAIFLIQWRPWRIGLTVLLLSLFYPITLTKMAFFSPIWLVALAILSRFVEARTTVILSLFLPLLAGIILLALFHEQAQTYFDVVNFRMIAVPSNALNAYNDYFAHHRVTHFCQISFLNRLLACPPSEPLSVIMENTYKLGFFNASLLATEGVASVGPAVAPAAVFACGLVISLGNCTSHGLPPRLILLSSAVVAQYLLNVPLTTVMLTHGAGLLFAFWYLTPRDRLQAEASNNTHAIAG